ncbi:hypothetical protein [Thermohalobacter berrensis]|nr:hypothetical protein [Thermohalobacter berrensis]
MDKDDKDKKTSPPRFTFLSISWWIFHIILIFLVFFILTRVF